MEAVKRKLGGGGTEAGGAGETMTSPVIKLFSASPCHEPRRSSSLSQTLYCS
ncbi:hypothetical protein Bca4012_049265 [Brassica carinata]